MEKKTRKSLFKTPLLPLLLSPLPFSRPIALPCTKEEAYHRSLSEPLQCTNVLKVNLLPRDHDIVTSPGIKKHRVGPVRVFLKERHPGDEGGEGEGGVCGRREGARRKGARRGG